MNNKPYISPSQLSLYTKCGEAYKRRYIDKDIIPPGIALIKGTAVHRGAEHNFKQKIESHVDLKQAEIVDKSVNTYEERIQKEGLFLSKEEEITGKSKIVGQGKDSTVRMAKLYSEKVAPKYQPEGVELKQKVEVPRSTHDLYGIIDLVDNKNTIIDLKTSAKSWSQSRVDTDGQLTFYSMLFKAKNKRNPRKLFIENLVDTKVAKLNTLETTRDEKDYERLVHRINAVVNGINKKVYTPAESGSWMCSQKFCGYWKDCKVRV